MDKRKNNCRARSSPARQFHFLCGCSTCSSYSNIGFLGCDVRVSKARVMDIKSLIKPVYTLHTQTRRERVSARGRRMFRTANPGPSHIVRRKRGLLLQQEIPGTRIITHTCTYGVWNKLFFFLIKWKIKVSNSGRERKDSNYKLKEAISLCPPASDTIHQEGALLLYMFRKETRGDSAPHFTHTNSALRIDHCKLIFVEGCRWKWKQVDYYWELNVA